MKNLAIKVFGYNGIQLKSIVEKHCINKDFAYTINEQDLDACIKFEYQESLREEFDNTLKELLLELGENVYREEDISLAQTAMDMLNLSNYKLSIAESLTGGLLADAFVSISGAGHVLNESLVTYANEAKINRLKVPKSIIEDYGAVSNECAIAMAEGLLKTSDSDIAVATTGIAGPTGDSPTKPMGLTYISIADRNNTRVYCHVFKGKRQEVRKQVVSTALFYLIKKIKTG